jgi:oxygen-independent coproporphyrinogen III oxidase
MALDTASPVAVYVHTPFCPSKCGYCDFNSYAMDGEIVGRTVEAIRAEILRSPWRGRPAKTIFFGGGTPTFLSEPQLISLLEAVMEVHPPLPHAEITSEANPGTVDASKFAAMRGSGFNRISLGAQSFLEDDLVRLGRVHRSGEIERAVHLARRAGFENVNLDLMFALPGQSVRAWRANLARAVSLEPDHLSLYCLTLEPNTAFYKEHLRGHLIVPDDEVQVEMYDAAVDTAIRHGYLQYEISNFAKAGKECFHNLCYWQGEPYAGYGPGAVGFMPASGAMTRYTNMKHPARYCTAVADRTALWCEHEQLTPDNYRLERIMLGLRLNRGFELGEHQVDPAGEREAVARGWLEGSQGRVQLTERGRHYCSEVALLLS